GVHDFKGFSSLKKTKKSTVREIYSLDIIELEREIQIRIRGNGFLYNMVRIICGTLVDIGRGTLPQTAAAQILS
ncbi:tRNA pseudouridine(38-40) synthase TruA, partial [Acinetobacter pittii]|nr:tRNA pseudouridine(38-40) synthase TruA [Acinetobacter pittii]